ncbi:RNA binding protein-like protein, partial [Euroglyphus maynei]
MQGRNAGYKAGPPPPSAAGSGGNGGYMMHQPTDVENDTIFISGMPLDVTEDQLSTHFGSIGIIKMDRSQKHRIWIYRDKVTGEGKGEATLTYEDPHTAKSAIQWFHGKELPGTGKILNVEFAQRKLPAGGDYKGGRGGRGGGGGFPMRGRGAGGDRGGGGGGDRGGR